MLFAGHHREGRHAACAAAYQGLGEESEDRVWHRTRLEVAQDLMVVLLELAGDAVDVVATLGDGQ